ncbi:hypothetical protein ACFQZ4_15640 [Catellatospora coxensis]
MISSASVLALSVPGGTLASGGRGTSHACRSVVASTSSVCSGEGAVAPSAGPSGSSSAASRSGSWAYSRTYPCPSAAAIVRTCPAKPSPGGASRSTASVPSLRRTASTSAADPPSSASPGVSPQAAHAYESRSGSPASHSRPAMPLLNAVRRIRSGNSITAPRFHPTHLPNHRITPAPRGAALGRAPSTTHSDVKVPFLA